MRITVLLILLFFYHSVFAQFEAVVDHRHTTVSQIPDNWIDSAKVKLKIRYFRRSHGSQVDAGGMTALQNYFGDKYAFSETESANSLFLSPRFLSVDYDPDIWASDTRAYLDNPSSADINVVMWAWSFEFYNSDIQGYLDTMENFIADYGKNGTKIQAGVRTVPVTFVFQTACSLMGDAENKIVFEGNQQIRKHCADNNRILFDFNDIECYNPDGAYFGEAAADGVTYEGLRRLDDDCSYIIDPNDPTTRGNWGIEWRTAKPDEELSKISADNVCTSCTHSDGTDGRSENSRLHCVLKGQAAWWLWAVLAGWDDGIATGIEQKQIQENVVGLKNYPNPFDNNTTIEYKLEQNAHVVLELWNINGQKMNILVDENQAKGEYRLPINIDDKKGVYFYTLRINGKQISKKMIKLK